MWERLKYSERFSFVNKSKVIHVVADDGISREWEDTEWCGAIFRQITGELTVVLAGLQNMARLILGWPGSRSGRLEPGTCRMRTS